MTRKIYFEDSPVFLCSKITPEIEDVLQTDGVLFVDEISASAVNDIVKQIDKPTFKAAVVFSIEFEKLKALFLKDFKTIRAGGGLVKNEKDEVLFIFRRGFWDLPKGKKDKGEKYKACAKREVEEETGLHDVKTGKKICTTYHTYIENGRNILKKTRWYSMKAGSSQPLTPQQDEGIQQIEWVNEALIPEKLAKSFPLITDVLTKANILIEE
ncbi:MAG: NUDIX domain-containing protein [Ginsengibacter sp.]